MLELKNLDEVDPSALLKVLSNPKIAKHLPLFNPDIDLAWIEKWIENKMSQWEKPELGPYAILKDGQVVGWGGYQPDDEVAELAIVLIPKAWGIGQEVVNEIDLRWAKFGDGRKRVFYLPHSRNLALISNRLGARRIGSTEVAGVNFEIFELPSQG